WSRRPRPRRAALRLALPRLRANPVGSASGGGCGGGRRGASAGDAAGVSGARSRDRGGVHGIESKEVIGMPSLPALLIAATPVGGKPDPNGLPGSTALEQLVN